MPIQARDWSAVDRRHHLLDDDGLLRLANAINEAHGHKSSTRVLIDDHRFIGLFGDRHIARVFGLPMNTRVTKWGDGRVPFTLNDGTKIDVMTRRAPKNGKLPDLSLNVKATVGPHAVILLSYLGTFYDPIICGWMPESEIRTYPIELWRDDVENFVVPVGNLRPIHALIARHDPENPMASPPVVVTQAAMF